MTSLTEQRNSYKRSKSEIQQAERLESGENEGTKNEGGVTEHERIQSILNPLKHSVISKFSVQEEKAVLQSFRDQFNSNLDKLKPHATRNEAFKTLQKLVIESKSAEHLRYILSSLSTIRSDKSIMAVECESKLIGIIAREYGSQDWLTDKIRLAERLGHILCANSSIADPQIFDAIAYGFTSIYKELLADQTVAVKKDRFFKPLLDMVLHGSNSNIQNIGAFVINEVYNLTNELNDTEFKQLVCSRALNAIIKNLNYLSGFAEMISHVLKNEDSDFIAPLLGDIVAKFLGFLQDDSKANDSKRKLELLALFTNIAKFYNSKADKLQTLDAKPIIKVLKKLMLCRVVKIVELARICEHEWKLYSTAIGANNSSQVDDSKLQSIVHKSYLSTSLKNKLGAGLNPDLIIQNSKSALLNTPSLNKKPRDSSRKAHDNGNNPLAESFVLNRKEKRQAASLFHKNKVEAGNESSLKERDDRGKSNLPVQVNNKRQRNTKAKNEDISVDKLRPVSDKNNRMLDRAAPKKSTFRKNHENFKELLQKDKKMHKILKKASKTLEELEKENKFSGVDEAKEEMRRRTIIIDEEAKDGDTCKQKDNIPSCQEMIQQNVPADSANPKITPKNVKAGKILTVMDSTSKRERNKTPMNNPASSLTRQKDDIVLSPSPELAKKLVCKNNSKGKKSLIKEPNPNRRPIDTKKLISIAKNNEITDSRSSSMKNNSKVKTKVNEPVKASPSKSDNEAKSNRICMGPKRTMKDSSLKPLQGKTESNEKKDSMKKAGAADKIKNKKKFIKKQTFDETIKVTNRRTSLERQIDGQERYGNYKNKSHSNRSFKEHEDEVKNTKQEQQPPIKEKDVNFEEFSADNGEQMFPTRKRKIKSKSSAKNKLRKDGSLGDQKDSCPAARYLNEDVDPVNVHQKAPRNPEAGPMIKPKANLNAALDKISKEKELSKEEKDNSVVFQEVDEPGMEKFITPAMLPNKNKEGQIIEDKKEKQDIKKATERRPDGAERKTGSYKKEPKRSTEDVYKPDTPESKSFNDLSHVSNPPKLNSYADSVDELNYYYSTITEESQNYTITNSSIEKTRFIGLDMQSTILFDNMPANVVTAGERVDNQYHMTRKQPLHMQETVLFDNKANTQDVIGYSLGETTQFDDELKYTKTNQTDKDLWSAIQGFLKRGDYNTAFQLSLATSSDKYTYNLQKRFGDIIQMLKPSIRDKVKARLEHRLTLENKEKRIN